MTEEKLKNTRFDGSLRRLAMWIVMHIRCGHLAPYLFGYAIGGKGMPLHLSRRDNGKRGKK